MRKLSVFSRSLFNLLIIYATLVVCSQSASQGADMQISWNRDFPSGAAENVYSKSDGAIAFSIPKEPGGGEYLWFHFEVTGVKSPDTEFVLENAAGAHQTGGRWQITRPVFSADGKTWVRAVETRYSREPGITQIFASPVFRFRSPISAETLRVAYCYPYTSEDLGNFLDQLKTEPDIISSSLGQSEEGRSIVQVDIEPRPNKSGENVPEIWVICREHPGETPASFVCEGMMDALLNHPAGQRLRDAFAFTFVPILNVDGVQHGYYYHNARGVNLARDWENFSSAEVRTLKAALETETTSKRLRLVINLHASNDPGKGHFFIEMPDAKLKPQDAEFQRSIFQAADGNDPQLQGRSRVKLLDLPGITGNALYQNYGVYCLYLESNYSLGADGSTVTPESLRRVGRAFVQALAEVLRPE